MKLFYSVFLLFFWFFLWRNKNPIGRFISRKKSGRRRWTEKSYLRNDLKLLLWKAKRLCMKKSLMAVPWTMGHQCWERTKVKASRGPGGRIARWLAYLLSDPGCHGFESRLWRFFWKKKFPKVLSSLRANCLNSGHQVDCAHPVLASGKLVLHKVMASR